MTTSKLEKKLQAQAQLVLQSTGTAPIDNLGQEPNDEELTSLYENTLDASRRAQVLGYIANDGQVYQRWTRCVETLTYMDQLDNLSSESESAKNRSKSTLYSNLYSKIADFFANRYVLSGGFSTAAIIVLVMSIVPQSNDVNIQLSFNEAYQQWAGSLEQEWQTLPESQKPTPNYSSDRSFFSEPKPKTMVQQVLETGFKKGINLIGDSPFKDFGISLASLSDIPNTNVSSIMTTPQYDTLVQTGQLAAFAALQCRLDSNNSERLEIFSTALTALRQQLNELNFDETLNLASATTVNNQPAVCITAQNVVDLITK